MFLSAVSLVSAMPVWQCMPADRIPAEKIERERVQSRKEERRLVAVREGGAPDLFQVICESKMGHMLGCAVGQEGEGKQESKIPGN